MIKCFSFFNNKPILSIHLCFEDGLLWSIGIGQVKELQLDPQHTYTIDSEIYCNVDSGAVFNDKCFDFALDLAEELLKKFEFEEYYEYGAED